jgi:hypothetical protein
VGVAVLVGVAVAVGSGVATVVSTGDAKGVGSAVVVGVAVGVAGGVLAGVFSGATEAVGAGSVIGVAAGSGGVASGVGAWAGAATPSTAAYIAATATPMARMRRIMSEARTRAGRGARWLSREKTEEKPDASKIGPRRPGLEPRTWGPGPTLQL